MADRKLIMTDFWDSGDHVYEQLKLPATVRGLRPVWFVNTPFANTVRARSFTSLPGYVASVHEPAVRERRSRTVRS